MSAPDIESPAQKRSLSSPALAPHSPHPSFHTTAPEESEPLVEGREKQSLGDGANESSSAKPPSEAGNITSAGLKVLVLLAVQNCSKNLLMRYVMKDRPNFLTSAAVIGVEVLKLVFSTIYILVVERRSLSTIFTYMRDDRKNSLLLAVPATAYSLQMSLEYVALANIDAAVFSVLVQTKLLATATFAVLVLRRKLKRVQLISLILLTAGVMLCNSKSLPGLGGTTSDGDPPSEAEEEELKNQTRGIMATLGIALSSGFASVYTEKVIKGQRSRSVRRGDYSLAYTQVQLALVSLVIIGTYALFKDLDVILEHGLFHGFNGPAFVSIFNSAIGGLIVAAVLKYADAVLKGYATAVSVIMTGVLSMLLFGTQLNVIYFLGIINVVSAVLLYSGKNLDDDMC